ncbi:hypothetical protein [Lysobacter sp. CA199]|uniref:hypothetical protein n=1 Tax=Lysobacter sp. CA199 TaxID=3455608 RepID=UPI003F8CF4D7
MKKLYVIVLAGFAFGMSQEVFAEVASMTGSAYGVSRESAIAAVKKKLNHACAERKGKSDTGSFKLEVEDKIVHPEIRKPYHVEASMKCDLREG